MEFHLWYCFTVSSFFCIYALLSTSFHNTEWKCQEEDWLQVGTHDDDDDDDRTDDVERGDGG